MEILLSVMKIVADRHIKETGTCLRGYIAGHHRENPIFHNHSSTRSYYYQYPLVQYKVIEGNAYVVGLNEGAQAIKDIADSITELDLGRSRYRVKETDLRTAHVDINVTRKRKYKFLTPWIGLSQDRYNEFISLRDWRRKKALLNQSLINHILFMAKRLGYYIIPQIDAHTHLEITTVRYKGFKKIAFLGEFEVPFIIPDYAGLGKGTSVGFGTVKRCTGEENETDSSIHRGNRNRRQ